MSGEKANKAEQRQGSLICMWCEDGSVSIEWV
jgi:hypothetical protein